MMLYIPKTENCDWYDPYPKITWDNLCHAVANPSTAHLDKDAVPLWAFYTPLDKPKIGYWGKPKFTTDNFKYCHALLMDFDNDESGSEMVSFDEIKERYGYKFLLYTSYRHRPDHHKFRMVIPLRQKFDHRLMRVTKVKEWFANHFAGVDELASIKTLQKHKIPAHHPTDTNYRYHIEDSDTYIRLPIKQFLRWKKEQEEEEERLYAASRNRRPVPSRVFDMTKGDIIEMNRIKNLTIHHVNELRAMSWERGSGNDVHGNLCRIAYSLQKNGIPDWLGLMLSFIPRKLHSEVKRMQL